MLPTMMQQCPICYLQVLDDDFTQHLQAQNDGAQYEYAANNDAAMSDMSAEVFDNDDAARSMIVSSEVFDQEDRQSPDMLSQHIQPKDDGEQYEYAANSDAAMSDILSAEVFNDDFSQHLPAQDDGAQYEYAANNDAAPMTHEVAVAGAALVTNAAPVAGWLPGMIRKGTSEAIEGC